MAQQNGWQLVQKKPELLLPLSLGKRAHKEDYRTLRDHLGQLMKAGKLG